MSDIDLAAVSTHADLVVCLEQLYIQADAPSYRDLEKETGREAGKELPGTRLKRVRLGRSAIGEMLHGSTFPKKAFLLTFVEACGVDIAADTQWAEAWDRLSPQYAKHAGQAQTEVAQLRTENARLHAEIAAERLVVGGMQAEEAGLRAEMASLRAEMKAQVENADRRTEEARLRAEADIGKAQAEKAALGAQLATAEKDRVEALGRLGRTQRQLADAQNEVVRRCEEVKELTEELKAQEREASRSRGLAPTAADPPDHSAVPGTPLDGDSGYGSSPAQAEAAEPAKPAAPVPVPAGSYGTHDSGSGYGRSGWDAPTSGWGSYPGYGQSGYGQSGYGSSPAPAEAAEPAKPAAPVSAGSYGPYGSSSPSPKSGASSEYGGPGWDPPTSGWGSYPGYGQSGYGTLSGFSDIVDQPAGADNSTDDDVSAGEIEEIGADDPGNPTRSAQASTGAESDNAASAENAKWDLRWWDYLACVLLAVSFVFGLMLALIATSDRETVREATFPVMDAVIIDSNPDSLAEGTETTTYDLTVTDPRNGDRFHSALILGGQGNGDGLSKGQAIQVRVDPADHHHAVPVDLPPAHITPLGTAWKSLAASTAVLVVVALSAIRRNRAQLPRKIRQRS